MPTNPDSVPTNLDSVPSQHVSIACRKSATRAPTVATPTPSEPAAGQHMHNASSDGPTPATSEGNTLSSVPAPVITLPSTISSETTVTPDVPPPIANVPPEGQTVPTAGHMLDVGVNNLLCLFCIYFHRMLV